jgi:hypothetical protein
MQGFVENFKDSYTAPNYLENEENSLLSDKLILCRLRTDIRKKENAAKKQTTILTLCGPAI